MSLEELFARDEESPPGARTWPWLRWAAGAAVSSILLGAGASLVLYTLGVRFWYPLAAIGVFAVLLLRRAVRGVGPAAAAADWQAPAEPDPDEDRRDQDGLVAMVYRWESRMRWERVGLWQGGRSLRPHLVELVSERMRQRHGCTVAGDPQRARRLLGDRLWRYLTDKESRSPSPRELRAMLTTVEEL